MTQKFTIAALGLAFGLMAAPQTSLAQFSPFNDAAHIEQAIEEAREAVAAGERDLSASVVEHATVALDHARAALNDVPGDAHIRAAITHLQRAIKTARGSHSARRAAVATNHVLAALGNLEYAMRKL